VVSFQLAVYETPAVYPRSADLADAPLLRALRGLPTEHTPVWFMRQAGRSLSEYRAVRSRASLFEIVRSPDLAAEVTIAPVHRLGVDAAVLFSDITVPLAAAGIDLEIVPGVGPVIAQPFRGPADLERLRGFDAERDAPYVSETVRLLARELEVPLIGFAGGPFTLASYLIEGGPSKTHTRTRSLMYSQPDFFRALLQALAGIAVASMRAQVLAGASALQLFESWVGVLDPVSFSRHVLPATISIFDGLRDLDVPTIYFGVGTGELLGRMAGAGSDALGVDWRVPMDSARARLPQGMAVQGNLDPVACLGPWDTVRAQALEVLRLAGPRGHVFNLGHGVLPETDPDTLRRLVDLVHGYEHRNDRLPGTLVVR
jgi:uroporphyrinogen decarboxylase